MAIIHPLPDEIVAARKTRGMTQTEAGKLIDMSLNTWAQWETGKRPMHRAYLALFESEAERQATKIDVE